LFVDNGDNVSIFKSESLSLVPLLTLCFAVSALAQTTPPEPTATLGMPQYSGTGCPSFSVSSALSPDGGALSLLFDNFVVNADRIIPVDRKTCNFAVPIQVPTGYRVSIIGIDYRGFNSLPVGAKADFSVEYFFAGGSTSPFRTTFNGPLTSNYLLQDTLDATNLVWSSCGGADVLRVNNALVVTTNAAGEQAQSTVDSIEVTVTDPNRYAGVIFHLNWDVCTTTISSSSVLAPSLAFLGTGLLALLAL
jgi:hypothetical protein